MSHSNRIDVHHHFVPDFYREALIASGGDPSGWHIPDWTPELDDDVNQKFGIGTSTLSLTAPGACILKDGEGSAALARKSNDFAAKLRDAYPKRYGFFASLPNLLDKDITLISGAELNRRHGVVFVHPTHPVDVDQVSNLPQPIIRYARNFYYDIALTGTENAFNVLETFAKPGHLLYGSDTPYANNSIIGFHVSRQDEYKFKDPKMHDKINRKIALELFHD